MIPSAKDYLTMWYRNWMQDLEKNLAEQAALKVDEATLRELVGTCEQAFAALFPAPPPAPEPDPVPAPAPEPVPEPTPPEPVDEPPIPEPDLGNPESGSIEGVAGPG